MTYPERVETERLLLRSSVPSDAEAIFTRYAGDPVVTRYLTWKPHESLAETIAYLDEKRREGNSFNWLIHSLRGGPLLGSIGCRRVEPHVVQFGYCLARDSWGQGYATEAARAMVPIWLASPDVWRVQAFCDPENVASARVLEKAGLTLEGTLRKYVLNPNVSDVPCDALCYARVSD